MYKVMQTTKLRAFTDWQNTIEVNDKIKLKPQNIGALHLAAKA